MKREQTVGCAIAHHAIGVLRLAANAPYVLLLAMTLATSASAVAADWAPKRPIRLIVPFPPGGAVDSVARIIVVGLPERLGQQVVVDNRGGANAIIGSELVAKAVPDGHTLLIVPSGHAITPSVTKKLPYDSVKDFA